MLTRQQIRGFLLNRPGVKEERPFGPDTAVFKVNGKIFALLPDDNPLRMNLKCDPDDALALRDMYPAVRPGYHMNKRHWNTVTVDGTITDDEVRRMMDDSFHLVIKDLRKAERQQLNNLSET